jgi:4-hydroxy-4-methyl-2-oxoglutarate aldolase
MNLKNVSFQQIQKLDTCTVSNTIERLGARLRNEGSVSGSAVKCLFPNFAPMLGYAVTGRMRSMTAPPYGRAYHMNMDWWRYVASVPEPKVIVIQDVDEKPGSGAWFGEVHAVIGRALYRVGYVTNGFARDLPAVETLGFHLFAGSTAVSHMYAHVCEFGGPVDIGGLKILPGDLIHGDRHGVHTIPLSVAPDIPKMASGILHDERELREFCQSSDFHWKAWTRCWKTFRETELRCI